MLVAESPVSPHEPTNRAILAVSEDTLSGFQPDPFGEIALRCGIPVETVIERVRSMLEAGTIRRVRQTLLTTNLAAGALIAWRVPAERLQDAFDYMFQSDPFSGHVVLRSTDGATAGSDYRLWTTVKVPQGYSLDKHCRFLASVVDAEEFKLMPAHCLFVLGVGHTRREEILPGDMADETAEPMVPHVVQLNELQWRVLEAVKGEFEPAEIVRDVWRGRAAAAGLELGEFVAAARELEELRLLGRFSTFLEHVKPLVTGERVTQYNALFHWAIPEGEEIRAGREIARHRILTHAYWREAGPAFGNVNVMGVTHGMAKERVLEHKAAIDRHLQSLGIEVGYTNVFWGGRSEIKPSEIIPSAYRDWCARVGIEPESMRAED